MREFVSGTTRYMRMSERAMKSKVRMIKPLSPQHQAIPEEYHEIGAIGVVSYVVHS